MLWDAQHIVDFVYSMHSRIIMSQNTYYLVHVVMACSNLECKFIFVLKYLLICVLSKIITIYYEIWDEQLMQSKWNPHIPSLAYSSIKHYMFSVKDYVCLACTLIINSMNILVANLEYLPCLKSHKLLIWRENLEISPPSHWPKRCTQHRT